MLTCFKIVPDDDLQFTCTSYNVSLLTNHVHEISRTGWWFQNFCLYRFVHLNIFFVQVCVKNIVK